MADRDVWKGPEPSPVATLGRIAEFGTPETVLGPGQLEYRGAFRALLRANGGGLVVQTLVLGFAALATWVALGSDGTMLIATILSVWAITVGFAWLSLRKLARSFLDSYAVDQTTVELHAHHLVVREATRTAVPLTAIRSVQVTKGWLIVRTNSYPNVFVIPHEPTFTNRLNRATQTATSSPDFPFPEGVTASYRVPSRLRRWVRQQRHMLGWPARISVAFFVVVAGALTSTGDPAGISAIGAVALLFWLFFFPSAVVGWRLQNGPVDAYVAHARWLSWRANGWGWDTPWQALTPGEGHVVVVSSTGVPVALHVQDVVKGDHAVFVEEARRLATIN